MSNRLSQLNRDTKPIHSQHAIAILHFTANLMRLADAGQRFHASPSELDDMSIVRDEISKCTSPIMNYSSQFVHCEGDYLTHGDLIMALNNVIIELKLRNSGNGQRDISTDEIDYIRQLINGLDECRKRVVFYR